MFTSAFAGGATSKQVYVRGYTASTGLPYTAGAFNTAGITANYRRAGATAAVAITLATQTIDGAWSSGGFVHVAGGVYRLDIPDAAIAASVDFVDIWVFGITDVVFTTVHIDITASDPRAATVTIADGGITAAKFGASAITSTVLADNAITAAKIAADAITDAKVASDVTIASVTGAVGSVTGAVGSVTGAVGSVTGAVGSVTGAVGSVATGGIAAASFAAGAINAAAIATAALVSAKFSEADPPPANVVEINDVTVLGIGTSINKWRGA